MSNFKAITKTAADIGKYVKRIFGDEAGVQIDDTDIIRWVNMGQREILITNTVNQAYATTDVISGQSDYTLSGLNVLQIKSIHLNGFPLQYMSFQTAEEYIGKNDPNLDSSGTPRIWYQYAGLVKLYPVPENTDTGALQVHYVKDFTEILAIGDLLSVPDEYFNRLCEYVMGQAYELDEDSQSSQYKLSQFDKGLSNMQEKETGVAYDTYPVITVLEDDMWDYQ